MINNVVLVGRITKDVELRKTQSGTSVVSFNLAVNRKFSKDETDFINCVAWQQTADFMARYLGKGDLIGVEGRIQTRNYEDKTGQRVYITEVVVESVKALNTKRREQPTEVEYVEVEEQEDYDIDPDLPFRTMNEYDKRKVRFVKGELDSYQFMVEKIATQQLEIERLESKINKVGEVL